MPKAAEQAYLIIREAILNGQLKEAEKIVNSGDFMGDEIIERDHFQITGSYEEGKE